jgi:riboflavin synthase
VFSGIVEEIGTVGRIDPAGLAPLEIRCRTVLEDVKLGDSIAVNGVCLTVTAFDHDGFTANVQPVTFRLTNLGRLQRGAPVNLERSIAYGGRIGGHYVQGHVDGVGRIVSLTGEGPSILVRIAAPDEMLRYVVERGYVAVDGASLTVMALHPDGFSVSLVHHTQLAVTLPGKRPGDPVNLEADVLGKYVERLLGQRAPTADDRLMSALTRNGWTTG